MTAYDPLRLPEGGRSIACALCQAPVPLTLENPRRVCAECGAVNLPTPEVSTRVAPGAPGADAGRQWRAFFRQPASLGVAWGGVGLALLPLVFGAAALGNELAGRGQREKGASLGLLVGALVVALPTLVVAALKAPPPGVLRGWRFLWLGVGMLLSSPIAFRLALHAVMGNWRS